MKKDVEQRNSHRETESKIKTEEKSRKKTKTKKNKTKMNVPPVFLTFPLIAFQILLRFPLIFENDLRVFHEFCKPGGEDG